MRLSPVLRNSRHHPSHLYLVDKDDADSPKAMWCGEGVIGNQKVRKLLVQNELLTGRKTETVNKKAEKELEAVLKALKSLRYIPASVWLMLKNR